MPDVFRDRTEGHTLMIPFRTILLAADFSDSSRDAFRVACSLARADRTRIIVLNVLEPKYDAEPPVYVGQQTVHYRVLVRDPSEHECLKNRLGETYMPDQPMDVHFQTAEGDTAEEILRSSEAIGCDLIVMGTHGRQGLDRLLAGSIAETVLRKAVCPVLALRRQKGPGPDVPIRVILHPTDFSDRSGASLDVARLLARDTGAQLILLHVTPPDILLEGTLAAGGDPRGDRDCLEEIRRRMEGPDLKCPVQARLDHGEPAAEILRAADEVRADLIVMGTHGRSGLNRMLMGSVAEAVLRAAACPVLIARSALPEPKPARSASTPRSDRKQRS
jgi:nucleotide-binding universal stress UspA family protein